MKIPKKLKIGGHIYNVRLVASGQYLGLDGDACSNKKVKHTIEIDASLAQTEIEASLLHEIFHALNAQWDANDTMHALMEATSQQLFQVLHDNKMLNEVVNDSAHL